MAKSQRLETRCSLSNTCKEQLNYVDDHSWAGNVSHASPYPAFIKDTKRGLFLHMGGASKAAVVYRGDNFDWLTAWCFGPTTEPAKKVCKVITEVAQRGAFSDDWDDIEKRLDSDGNESSKCVWEEYTASVSITCKDDTARLTGTISIAG